MFRLFLLILPFSLIACSKQEPPQRTEPVVRPVKSTVIQAPITSGIRRFPARIDADRKTLLSFRVGGHIKKLWVKAGEMVDLKQTVAELDPTDFKIILHDREASYSKALKNFNRAKKLIKKNYISQTDFDRLEAEYKNAQSALEIARQNLAYTVLKAPFGGLIAQRFVETFEEVKAGQPIMELQNIDRLEVKFNIPETIIRSLRLNQPEGETNKEIKVYAMFDDLPEQKIPLQFKEIDTRADPKTQTFEVTYTMAQLPHTKVLPGMTAIVSVDFSDFLKHKKAVYLVPISAVVGDYKLDSRVWVVNEDMSIKPVPVKVGKMFGHYIEVTEGVKAGMRIVTAGAAFLSEDMKVKLLPEKEQAEPRRDERSHS